MVRRDASKGRAAPKRILTYRAAGYWRRAAAYACWLSVASVVPGAAISNTLGGLLLVSVIFSVGVLGRLSPLPKLIAASGRRFAKALRTATRARIRVVAPAISPLWAVLFGLAAWVVTFVLGAVAISQQSLPLALVAAALVGLSAWAMRRLAFARRPEGLTIGLDGVAVDGHGFAAWREIVGAGFSRVPMPGSDTQPALVIDVDRGAEAEAWAVPMDEEGANIFARELERRRLLERPDPGAGLSDALVTAGAVPWREPAVRVADLVRTLRDPGAGREERVRVADVLREHAPEEVDRFAEETADAELEAEIARQTGTKRSG